MIGYDVGAPGGRGWDPKPAADRFREAWDDRSVWLPRAARPLQPIWGWVRGVARETVSVLETVVILTPIRIERWETFGDERTCPECAPLHGLTWREGVGTYPPIHVNCRCRRVFSHTVYQRREKRVWRQRQVPVARRTWRITGWR